MSVTPSARTLSTTTTGSTGAPPSGRAASLGHRIADSLDRSARARASTLVGVVVLLTLGVFGTYLVGMRIPPWDFMGGYNTEAYYWWTHGSLASPVEWVPSNWGGYPAAVILQNSAWYLPTGIAALFGPLTLHTGAIVFALHVAFGSFGAYALARGLRQRYLVALFAAVAWFFAVGFFSNAEHPDIARGYAWAPWVLLVLTPRWPWRRWWAIPTAALILWQAATGIYPGMVLAAVYVVACWAVVAFCVFRPRPAGGYLIRVGVAAVAGGLLCAPRLWPYLQTGSVGSSDAADTSAFSWAQIGTLVFGYGSNELPNDLSMRSFFIPATVLVLVAYARWRDPLARLGVTLFIPAFLLGMPFWPWFTAIQNLPGLGSSRFTMSDFKVFLVLGVLLVALSGLARLLGGDVDRATGRRAVAGNAGLVVVLGAVGVAGPYALTDWVPGLFLVAVAAGLCAIAARAGRRGGAPGSVDAGSVDAGSGGAGAVAPGVDAGADVGAVRAGVVAPGVGGLFGALVVLTVVSGLGWAVQSHATWLADRVSTEKFTYGAEVADLIAERESEAPATVRPARTPLPEPITAKDLNSKRWNAAAYTGQDAVGGYVNLKGTSTGKALTAALLSKQDGPAVNAFLAAPGTVLTPAPDAPERADALRRCVEGDCGPADVKPITYLDDGKFFGYDVSVPAATTALFNETYYPGRIAQACSGTPCVDVPLAMDETGLLRAELPAGSYTLWVDYRTPGLKVGMAAFWAGALLALGAGAASGWVGLRRRTSVVNPRDRR